MILSISTDKMFRRCQRQWFYKQVYSNANSRKDRSRYEAFLLSKLQSLSALRGQVVDDVLSEHLVPALNRGIVPRCEEIQSHARERFEQRLAYAKAHQLDQRLSALAKLPDQFAMLFDYEYGVGIMNEDYDRAFAEIDESIENLFAIEELLDTLKGSERILSQRALIPMRPSDHGRLKVEIRSPLSSWPRRSRDTDPACTRWRDMPFLVPISPTGASPPRG
jgi:hypothetical protein